MGDMAEIFNAMKEAAKERRAERLDRADDAGWEKHTPYHWHRTIDGKKLNYWPSSGLVMIGQKKHNINSRYIREMLKAAEAKS